MIGPLATARRVVRAGLWRPHEVPKLLGELHLELETLAESRHDGVASHWASWLGDELERWRRAHQFVDPAHPGPTPETVSKLRRDPIEAMLRRGTLAAVDMLALEDLRAVREALARGLVPRGLDPDAVFIDHSRKAFLHPVDRMSERMALVIKHVYRPWAEAMGEQVTDVATVFVAWHALTAEEKQLAALTGGLMDAPLIDRHEFLGIERSCRRRVRKRDRRIVLGRRKLQLTRFQLVFLVLEEGQSLRQIERSHAVRSGRLTREFTVALRDFGTRLENAIRADQIPPRR